MKRASTKDRLMNKTRESLLVNHFKERYKFSQVVAEALSSDAVYLKTILDPNSPKDGQILRYVVNNTEPAGKPLKECQYVQAKLTINDPSDTEYRQKHGLIELKLKIIKRITDEAVNYSGCLSHEDIAELLVIDRGTVSDYIKVLESRGTPVYTRAYFTDSGRGISHKIPIIKLFLLGVPETEISQRTGHILGCVETYIRDFIRIALSHRKGNGEAIIARITSLSLKLIKEYLNIYKMLENDSSFEEPLHRLLNFYETGLLPAFKKGAL